MSEINDTKEIPEGTFPINLKLIKKYQRMGPSLINKYKDGKYHTFSFGEGGNIYLILIMCEDNIVILGIIKIYVLHWYHTYLLHPLLDITESIICQHLYCPGIRNAVRKELTNCDT